MAKNPPDERVVYLAFKNIFIGPDQPSQKVSKIKRLVQAQIERSNQDIVALVAEHNIDNVSNTVQSLLKAEVFTSTIQAKIRFPEVFEVSPAQSAERAVSEAEAARTDVDAIRSAVEGIQEVDVIVQSNKLKQPEIDKGKAPDLTTAEQLRKRFIIRPSIAVPSLYPIYLPHAAQHRLFAKVQALLEKACYAFGQEFLADWIHKEGWDCPEDVELNNWARIFRLNEEKFDPESLNELGKPFSEFLSSIAEIRHTAVHRLHISANTVLRFMVEAESLAHLLPDAATAQNVSRLRRETQQLVGELGRQKDLLETVLKEKLQDIDRRRRELDRLEREAVEEMLNADKEYQAFAGLAFRNVLSAPVTALHSESSSERDLFSGEDTESEDPTVIGANDGRPCSSSSHTIQD